MKKVYIITGANGFLGNNIIRNIKLENNDEIRALVRNNSNVESLNGLNCKLFVGDITDKNSLEKIFDITNANIICIHCAAIVYIKDKFNKEVFDVNVNGTINIAKKCIEKNARLIYISSVHAIKEPKNNNIITETNSFNPKEVKGYYAKSKAEALRKILLMSKNENLNVTILHPSGIIGPYDFGNTHLTNLILKVANNSLHYIVNGGYNFVDVRDVSLAVINSINKGKKGECYIISNKYASIKELCDIISNILKIKKVKTIPIILALLVVPFYQLYYNLKKQTPLFTKYSLYTLKSNSNFSNLKAKCDLNFQPRSLEETIKDTIIWLKNNDKF